MRMHTPSAFLLLTLAATANAWSIGCSSSKGNTDPLNGTNTTRASLHRAKGCGDLLADLKADAAYKLNRGIDRQIEMTQACMRKYSDDRCTGFGYAGDAYSTVGRAESAAGYSSSSSSGAIPPSAPTPAPATNQGAGAASSSSSGGTNATDAKASSPTASTYSETNTQVKGVDEADIVKNDGQNLYVLHGRAFKVVHAWPAAELKESGTIDIEGTPSEMFVSDGKVVVYSQVNGAAIFAAAGVTPKQQYQEWGYGYGVYAGGNVAVDARPAPGGYAPTPPGGGVTYAPLTKVTVLALDGTAPSVTREIYVEGNYLDSRRVGSNVRTVFQSYQYGPKLKYSIYELYPPQATPAGAPAGAPTDVNSSTSSSSSTGGTVAPAPDPYPKTGSQTIVALEQLRAANLAAIEATQLGDWLPYTFVRNGAAVSVQGIACEDFYVPTVGSTQGGMTEVASLDLADPAATPRQTAILGQADTVYANADSLYLATHAWVEPPFFWNDPYETAGGSSSSGGGIATPPSTGAAPAPAPAPGGAKPAGLRPLTTPPDPGPGVISWSSSNTHIHKLEFKSDPKFANYVASGTVAGSVKDQFSLDEKDDVLRIATTENRQYVSADGRYVQPDFASPGGPPPVRPNTVNHVYTLGQDGPWLDLQGTVGDLAPNETIYSVRFVENRGYVVTFRQVDPLFVIDLANPKNPTLTAALTIPGFSEYMHPLDPNHLLTIGRNASTTGRTQGLQLQIFDVTNALAPVVVHKFTYSAQEYGQSEAEYDHKAFTYFADKNLLAFPYFANGYNQATGVSTMRSSLEIFRVDLASGFTKLGSIDHTPLVQKYPSGWCGGYYQPTVRRGVFLENVVYSISYGGIIAKDANNLAAAGNEMSLPTPQINEGYGPVCVAY
jgi:uncharacterized secreted protein with C-terminal beta-propeller domain